MEITALREASVKDLRSFIAERGFSTAGLLERHELEARAEEAAAATQGGAAEEAVLEERDVVHAACGELHRLIRVSGTP